MSTRRQQIEDMFMEREVSAQQIANLFRVEMSEILEDMEHIILSRREEYKLKTNPAYCKNCGFIFRERSKIKAPSKCPRCRKEWIQEPLFRLEKINKTK